MRALLAVEERASAIASSTDSEGWTSRPCSSHVYQLVPMFASTATSSRRGPGTRRRGPFASPTSQGRTRSRRDRRNRPSSLVLSCAMLPILRPLPRPHPGGATTTMTTPSHSGHGHRRMEA